MKIVKAAAVFPPYPIQRDRRRDFFKKRQKSSTRISAFRKIQSFFVWIDADKLFQSSKSKKQAAACQRRLPNKSEFKETLIKSTCADLRQKFSLARKKAAGILTDFKVF